MARYLESRGAAELARTMAAEDATIDLGGFPFVPRFIGGTLRNVTVRVGGASAAGGLRVHSVDARMESVSFDASEIFALARSSFATKTEVTAKQPIVMLELHEGDLYTFLRGSLPIVADVQVKGSGVEVRFLKPGIEPLDPEHPREKEMTKPARLLPRIVDRRLQLVLTSISQIPPQYRAEAERLEELIDLPRFPEGMSAQPSLRDGVIGVESQAAEVTLDVGEATEDG